MSETPTVNERWMNGERTEEGAAMGITGELRDWSMDAFAAWIISRVELDALHSIADRIEAAHERALADAALDAAPTEAQLSELGWVELPVDADGVPIHVGDRMALEDGEEFDVIGISDSTLFYVDDDFADAAAWTQACNKHHVKPDSWERIIHDAFVASQEHFGSADAVSELVERCRRLAGV